MQVWFKSSHECKFHADFEILYFIKMLRFHETFKIRPRLYTKENFWSLDIAESFLHFCLIGTVNRS